MKSKDVLDVLAGKGIALKSSSTLEPDQFELLLNTLTSENQIDNIGDYLDGVTYIPSKVSSDTAKKPSQPAEVEEKSTEVKEGKIVEQKAADAVKPNQEKVKDTKPTATEKPAPKTPAAEKKADAANDARAVSGGNKPRTDAPARPAEQKKPEAKASQRPAMTQAQRNAQGMSADERIERFAQQRQGQQNNDRHGKPQFDKQRGNGQQRPQGQKNDRFGGGQMFDKDERQQKGPRETFKPQVIVRGQTVKGDVAPKQRGATRVVDM
ncbi:MAG: hypothetical protein J6U86_00415, partial [Clostridia bacterium]|nr:hypothetical protein [Clostridia bacterium]